MKVLLAIIFLTISIANVCAQEDQRALAMVPVSAAPTHEQTISIVIPAMKPEDQLKIRNLQFQQDKKLLEQQRLEARYRQLQEEIKADETRINDAVQAGARAVGVDLSKFVFDLDLLKFVPRPAPVVNQPTKPLEVRP
jgi:hypothetical protein